MKLLIYLFLTMVPLIMSAQNKNREVDFLIRGKIDPVGDLQYASKAILVYPDSRRRDTALILRNKFEFKGQSSNNFEKATIYLQYSNLDSNKNRTIWAYDSRTVLLERGKIKMVISRQVKTAIIRAGKQNTIWNEYLGLTQPITSRIDSLRQKRSTMDSSLYRQLLSLSYKELSNAQKQFIKAHPSFPYSLVLLTALVKDYLGREWKADSVDAGLLEYLSLYQQLDPKLKKEGQHVYNQLESSRQRIIIPFSGETPDGKTLNVSSLKGKVFLIDFWGSWCIWCRKGHPHLKELYARYKDHGFEILGVGHEPFGKNRDEQWNLFREAIQKDGISWLQILNDPATNDLVEVYMVRAFPTKILVDRDGKILLRVGDDHDRRIDSKLKELFGF